jgi:hypothetical protein
LKAIETKYWERSPNREHAFGENVTVWSGVVAVRAGPLVSLVPQWQTMDAVTSCPPPLIHLNPVQQLQAKIHGKSTSGYRKGREDSREGSVSGHSAGRDSKVCTFNVPPNQYVTPGLQVFHQQCRLSPPDV